MKNAPVTLSEGICAEKYYQTRPCHLDTSLRLSPLLRKFVQKNVIKIGPCHLEWGEKDGVT